MSYTFNMDKLYAFLMGRLEERLEALPRDDLMAVFLHGVAAGTQPVPIHLARVAEHCKAVNLVSLMMSMVDDDIEVPFEMIVEVSACTSNAGISAEELMACTVMLDGQDTGTVQ